MTWKKRIEITFNIIYALRRIHEENVIHRDLHSGNILYLECNDEWYISDLGFSGPAEKPLKSVYGIPPYIAPEVLAGKECTFASDVYSIGMLMWEISSGQPPFAGSDDVVDLALKILDGMRPNIVPGTPLEYKSLMKQCWDADPSKRPDIHVLYNKIQEMIKPYVSNESSPSETNNNLEIPKVPRFEITDASSILFTSNIYTFENVSEPKNATEGKNYILFMFLLNKLLLILYENIFYFQY